MNRFPAGITRQKRLSELEMVQCYPLGSGQLLLSAGVLSPMIGLTVTTLSLLLLNSLLVVLTDKRDFN